MTVLST